MPFLKAFSGAWDSKGRAPKRLSQQPDMPSKGRYFLFIFYLYQVWFPRLIPQKPGYIDEWNKRSARLLYLYGNNGRELGVVSVTFTAGRVILHDAFQGAIQCITDFRKNMQINPLQFISALIISVDHGIAYAGYTGKPASGDSLAVHQILDVDYDNSAIHFWCYDNTHHYLYPIFAKESFLATFIVSIFISFEIKTSST